MKQLLTELLNYKTLTRDQARQTMVNMANGDYNDSHVAAFITVYMMRSITINELEGFQEALLELCVDTDLSAYKPVDVCGTGGDGKNTFNISTLSAFVAAGAGIKVAKHGNYGVSSVCGSSNVMEHLGYFFTNKKDDLEREIDEAGICFLHAPLFHPALKQVGPVRKSLGMKTFFNMMGPLVNPAHLHYQTVGVFSLELARKYDYLFQQRGFKNYTIIHNLDGYDEVSLTGSVQFISQGGKAIKSPQELGFDTVQADDITGGNSIEEAAAIFIKVLKNEDNLPRRAAVLANATTAIQCVRPHQSWSDSLAQATDSLDSGTAYKVFKKSIELASKR